MNKAYVQVKNEKLGTWRVDRRDYTCKLLAWFLFMHTFIQVFMLASISLS